MDTQGQREATRAESLAMQFARFSDQERREFGNVVLQHDSQRAFDKAGINDSIGPSLPNEASPLAPYGELTIENVDDAMRYHQWGPAQTDAGNQVRDALTLAAKTILRSVQRSPLRTRALNCLIDARMIANAAITHRGRF